MQVYWFQLFLVLLAQSLQLKGDLIQQSPTPTILGNSSLHVPVTLFVFLLYLFIADLGDMIKQQLPRRESRCIPLLLCKIEDFRPWVSQRSILLIDFRLYPTQSYERGQAWTWQALSVSAVKCPTPERMILNCSVGMELKAKLKGCHTLWRTAIHAVPHSPR